MLQGILTIHDVDFKVMTGDAVLLVQAIDQVRLNMYKHLYLAKILY